MNSLTPMKLKVNHIILATINFIYGTIPYNKTLCNLLHACFMFEENND